MKRNGRKKVNTTQQTCEIYRKKMRQREIHTVNVRDRKTLRETDKETHQRTHIQAHSRTYKERERVR